MADERGGRRAPGWHVPRDATPESLPDELLEVPGGIVRPFERGVLELPGERRGQWTRGAAHDAHGRLLERSRRVGGIAGDASFAVDPPWIEPGRAPARIEGIGYFAGPWMAHFGHFLLETLPTLWALPEDVPALLLPTVGWPAAQHELDLLRLAGVSGEPVRIARETRVDTLLVPSRPVALNGWASPAAASLWRRMGDRAAAGIEPVERRPRIWFSRARAELDDRKVIRRIGGESLDDAFAARGFEVVHPEELTVDEQLRLARGASVLAAFEGSALHLSAFAGPGAHVLMVGSERRPHGNRAQATIDAALGNHLAVVQHGAPLEVLADVDAALAAL